MELKMELNEQICGACKPWLEDVLVTLMKKYETKLVSEYDRKSQDLLSEFVDDIKQNFFVIPKPKDALLQANPIAIPKGNKSTEKIHDICFIYSQETGSDIANKMTSLLNAMKVKTSLVSCPPPSTQASFDVDAAESTIAQSSHVVLIVSVGSLQTPTLLFAALSAVTYTIRISLLHDESSCKFPGREEQPDFLVDASVFHDKAVTYLENFADTAAEQIKKKLAKKQMDENIRTTAFLSHKRSSAQGIAGRIYQGLASDYRIFLDSECDFDLHDLQLIVKETGLFIFILSEGIFESRWCMEELRSAIQNHKRVILIRNHTFHIPKKLPDSIKDLQDVLTKSPTIVYMAEFYTQCIQKLKELLGPSDQEIQQLEKHLDHEFSKTLQTHQQHRKQGLPSRIALKVKHVSREPQSASKLLSALLTRFNVEQIDDSVEFENFNLDANTVQLLTRLHPAIQSLKLVKCTLSFEDFSEFLKSPFLKSLSVIDCDPAFIKIIPAASSITSFTVKSSSITDATLPQIVQSCSNLQCLDLQECENLGNQSVISISNHLSGLESLSIRGSEAHPTYQIKDDAIQALAANCRFLKSLNLGWCTSLTDASIKALADKCNQLESLNLDKNNHISDAALEAIAEGSFSQSLQSIALNSDLNNFGKVTDKGLKALSKCHNLKAIELVCRKALSDDVFADIGSGCLNLEVLKVNGCSQLTNKSMKSITQHCKKLKTIDISSCDKMTDESAVALGTSCRELESVIVQSTGVADAGLIAIAENCPSLQLLNASNCNVTDTALESIGKLKHLKTLQLLKFSNKVTDKGLSYLTDLPNLEIINLYGAQITSQGIAKLAQGCHKLTTLNLTYTQVGSEGIEALAKSNPYLITLNLQECSKMNNNGLKALGSYSHFLQTLNLTCAGTLSDEGVKALAEGCWQLQHIELEGTAITDASVNLLKELKNIKYINAECKAVGWENKKVKL